MALVHSRNALPTDLAVVVSWIASRRECALWAGPTVPFALEPSALAAQIDMPSAMNVALDDQEGLVAFGQALRRSPARAHLARLIVRPDARRRGLGRVLVETLLARAGEAGLTVATLSVSRDNVGAVTLYSGLGFDPAERPPGDLTSAGTWFMQRSIDASTVHPASGGSE